MLGFAAGGEDLHDNHAATAAGTRLRQCGRLIRLRWSVALKLFYRGGWCREQLAGAGKIVGADAAGKQTVVADAVEALGQPVHQKAPDEFMRGKGHDLVAGGTVGAIILVSEGHPPVVAGDQSMIGDGDAVGVTREIGEHCPGPAERGLAVDVPLDPARWS